MQVPLSLIPNGYFISRVLGSGASGTVYELCDAAHECTLVLKIEYCDYADTDEFMDLIDHEVEMQDKFAAVGLAPYILWHGFYKNNVAGIVMERIDATLKSVLFNAPSTDIDAFCTTICNTISEFIDIMCHHNLVHGDLHLDNIGVRGSKFLLLDFGTAESSPCNVGLELAALLNDVNNEQIPVQRLKDCLFLKLVDLWIERTDDADAKDIRDRYIANEPVDRELDCILLHYISS